MSSPPDMDAFLADPSVLAALDNLEREHQRGVDPAGGTARAQTQPQPQRDCGRQAVAGPRVTVKPYLMPAARLGFQFPFNSTLVAAMKSCKGCEFDHSRKMWTIGLGRYDEVRKALASTGLNLHVELLPEVANKIVKASSSLPDDSELYAKIPAGMEAQMMEFQREGVRFALAHGGRVLLGDEMGLGKTVQAIALMKCYDHLWPCLIITPSSLREQWADALHRWLGITDARIHIVYEKKDIDMGSRAFEFLIISYDYVVKMEKELTRRKFRVVVCDESHYIKNHNAARTKHTLPLIKSAQRCVLCSGTPALSRPIELFTQMTALLPGANIQLNKFADRFCQGNNFSKYGGASHLDELHNLSTATFMKRRLKKDVLSQLPPKMRQQIFLQLGEAEMRPVRELQKQLEAVKAKLKDEGAMSEHKMAEKLLLNELYVKSAEGKVKAVQRYISELLEADEKVLVFAHHRCLLDGIEACLRKARKKFIRIDGATAAHERQGLVTRFQESPDHVAAVLSLRAAGQGLTLTAAHVVVMAELSWTPGELVQAEDRAHRIGQADSVAVHYLHARNTIDDIIWQTIQNKLDNIGQTLDGHQDKLAVSSQGAAAKADPKQAVLTSMLREGGRGGQPQPAPKSGRDQSITQFMPSGKRPRPEEDAAAGAGRAKACAGATSAP
eukprot:jgi/Tetstr1/458889/TSEL_004396.t1